MEDIPGRTDRWHALELDCCEWMGGQTDSAMGSFDGWLSGWLGEKQVIVGLVYGSAFDMAGLMFL